MSTSPEIDQTDLEIVELLREDARRTFADIAERVSISAPAVKRRVDRLRQDGLILGYTVILDHRRLGMPLQAFVELRFDGRTKVDDITSVASGITEVEALYTTAGDPDAVGLVRARDVEDLKRVIDLLRRSRHITGTKTLMILGTWEPSRDLRDSRSGRSQRRESDVRVQPPNERLTTPASSSGGR